MALLLNHLVSFVSRDEMFHRRNADFTTPSHGLLAVSLWTLSASVSVLSSRYLLVEVNYHFPLHLLLVNLFVASAFLVSQRFVSAVRTRYQDSRWLPATVEYTGEPSPDDRWYRQLLPAICVAAALPLSMEALLHWTNLSSLALLPVVAYLFCDMCDMISFRHPSIWFKLLEVSLHSGCCVVLLYDEYRLSVPGLVCALLAMLFIGVAMACFQDTRSSIVDFCADRRRSPSPILTLAASLLVTLVWCIKKEDTLVAAAHLLDVDPILIGLNVASTVAAILLGNSFILPVTIRDHFSSDCSKERITVAQISATFGFTALVGFASSYMAMRSYATVLQTGAYCLALVCILNGPHSDDNGQRIMLRSPRFDLEHFRFADAPDDYDDSNPEQGLLAGEEVSRRYSFEGLTKRMGAPSVLSIAAYAVVVLTWVGFLACNFAPAPGPDVSDLLPQLDFTYSPQHEFDVVISMYEEPVSSVQSIMEGLSAIPAIAASSPRLFLYTKKEDIQPSDLAELKELTKAVNVTKLPNVGREGETYLEHILLHWDSLAKQTLFVQADVHNPREFFDRIRDYYAPDTGMLSLGFSGKTCNTANCGDRWGWYEEESLLNDICRRVNGETCENMLLSYKGQFIASAKRIRGVDKELYEDLRVAMTDPGSWAHKEPYLKGRKDSLNAPRFGYTMERLWSVVMQCSTEEIAWRCPTLLSRARRGGDLSDCQCFDPTDALPPTGNSTVST